MKDTVKALRHHKNIQKLNKRILGDEYIDNDYVCCWSNGKPLDPHHVCQKFKALVEKHDFPELTFHGLRHTHATMLLLAGVHPKVVSERLGHSTISITLDLYSHVLPNMQQEAVDKLDELLSKNKPKEKDNDELDTSENNM
ncbi:tyrosine-type recombinase/integrase [Clostridium thermarum]|uniref:tyrosine-type recombinase/integrase n=1 Tax=Clostridium thermarum TaxID=1716543 RepID=UPI0013D4408F|nr:site-specific integrase [Clostridium thermarum]